MDSAPASCLPEADSLPDGFVESSAEEPLTAIDHDYKEPPVIVDGYTCPVHIETEALIETKIPSETSTNSEDVERCLQLCTTELKEASIGNNESSQNGKLESSEAKRKVTKRNTKVDKELLDLTLKYQKALTEREAAVVVREKLESLCRELQRQNKLLMDECQRVSTEGQNMRLDLSTKFNDAIKDIGSKLEEQKDECLGQLRENEMLKSKLKHLADQYALSEQQFVAKLNQKALELQLADLKLKQQEQQSVQDQAQIRLYVEQVTQLLDTEKSLHSQLAADGEKFQQFQDALLKSNEVFETFKQDMEKMTKLIKDLKRENVYLKNKSEESDVAIVKLVEERELMKKQCEKHKNQKEKLESLCRSLQAERKRSTLETSRTDLGSIQEKAAQIEGC